jgi:hypothetical protein
LPGSVIVVVAAVIVSPDVFDNHPSPGNTVLCAGEGGGREGATQKKNKGVRGVSRLVLSLRSGHRVCGVRSFFVCGNILRSAVSQEVAELLCQL